MAGGSTLSLLGADNENLSSFPGCGFPKGTSGVEWTE